MRTNSLAVNRINLAQMIKFTFLAAFLLVTLPASHAQTINVSGRYQCASAKVQGRVIPCNAAPLTLKNDGKFELRGWEGNYAVTGEWVELSDTVVRSRAKIEPGHKIIFRYHGKHGWCEMVYERRIADLGKTALS
jgi:hypothetical protein